VVALEPAGKYQVASCALVANWRDRVPLWLPHTVGVRAQMTHAASLRLGSCVLARSGYI